MTRGRVADGLGQMKHDLALCQRLSLIAPAAMPAKMKPRTKRVYLVGAGPGDPDLLTAKAVRVMKGADVVLYDRLVDRRVLRALPRTTLKVLVGRGKESAQQRQERIYRLIQRYHSEGLTVVRLKNGDPLLFGRGGEEIEFLRSKGISYEVIPGITSATGVPSSLGLPLTHRQLSSQVLIVSGHSARKVAPDWKAIAKFKGTLVVLMGAAAIGSICKGLLEGGKDPGTPSCIISRGTSKGERVVCGNLEELESLAGRKEMAPAIVVIGEVVKLAKFYRTEPPS